MNIEFFYSKCGSWARPHSECSVVPDPRDVFQRTPTFTACALIFDFVIAGFALPLRFVL